MTMNKIFAQSVKLRIKTLFFISVGINYAAFHVQKKYKGLAKPAP